MNILPKKRWHVRTKENIARVRRDEAEAAEKERAEQSRIENANREARLTILKNKSKQRLIVSETENEKSEQEIVAPLEHVNLFENLDQAITTSNKEHDKEIKEKKEEYEKKIGYLTYLGQDTNEALGKKNWYEVHPESSRLLGNIKDTYDKLIIKDKDGKPKKRELDEKNGEIDWKRKQNYDPINGFREYCEGKEKLEQKSIKCHSNTKDSIIVEMKDSKKRSKHKTNKDKNYDKLRKLREARLKREQKEKQKTEMFLTQLNGGSISTEKVPVNKITPKYNSQFNPELARQNYM